MPSANQHETEDQKKPRRAAIYLSEPAPNQKKPGGKLSIDQQAVLCRYAAKALQLEIVGLFADKDLALRPGLHQAMAAAQTQRLDYLIVSSLERLAHTYDKTVEVAWRLGRAGTVPIPAEAGCEALPAKARLR